MGKKNIRFSWDGYYAYGDSLGESLEFCLNTPDGTRNGTIWLELEGDCLTIHEMEGEAFSHLRAVQWKSSICIL